MGLKDEYTVQFTKIFLTLIYLITELYTIFYHVKFRLIAQILQHHLIQTIVFSVETKLLERGPGDMIA